MQQGPPSSTKRRRRRAGTAEALESAIDSIYEAATDLALWPKALSSVVEFVGNSGSHLVFVDDSTGLINPDVHVGMPAKMLQEYNGERVKSCPRFESARRQPFGTLCYDYQHIEETDIDRSEYYNWLQRQGDSIRYYLAARLDTYHQNEAWLSLAFRHSEGHSEMEHHRCFKAVLPHVNRAIRISQRLGTWELASMGTLAALSSINLATFVLGVAGKVLQLNATADLLLKRGDIARLAGGRVQFRDPAADRAFQGHLSAAVKPDNPASLRGGSMALLSPVSGDTYSVTVSALRMNSVDTTFSPACAIAFVEQRAAAAFDCAHIQSRFGLTPAEARLAGALASGARLAEIARTHGVSIHTVRAQLKALMQKTGTHRQAALIRLLLAS